ncbi:hypothetical protein [Vagococcus lutrae]|nr:hypothetical protein [Vagococcus lutrae]
MKHTKKVVAMMMVGGVVLASATTVKADDSVDSKQTNAQVKVTAGELKFEGDISATAKMNFQDVTFNGKSHTQSLQGDGTSVIKVGDYRGNNAKWNVTVKDTRTAITAGTQSFVTGMDITVNPTGNNNVVSQGEKTLNNSAQKVFSGGALLSKVDLHPQLTVPGSALAGDYQTVLEWVLSPGE